MDVAIRRATLADEDALVPLVRSLYEHEGLAFDAGLLVPPLRELLAGPTLGAAWLAEAGRTASGYALATWGFSTEMGGRFLLLDELLVVAELRGRGVGRRLLAAAEDYARAGGAGAIRLEVSDENPRARDLYLAAGYADPGRRFLAKRLGTSPPPR